MNLKGRCMGLALILCLALALSGCSRSNSSSNTLAPPVQQNSPPTYSGQKTFTIDENTTFEFDIDTNSS